MSTPPPPQPVIKHVEASADALVQDVIAWVRGHPAYAHLVETLGTEAIRLLAGSAGINL